METIARETDYTTLIYELQLAADQATTGKGAKRHACGQDFKDQVLLETTRRVGLGFPLGQAVKKIYESQSLLPAAAIHELHGAIVYLTAAAVFIRETHTK